MISLRVFRAPNFRIRRMTTAIVAIAGLVVPLAAVSPGASAATAAPSASQLVAWADYMLKMMNSQRLHNHVHSLGMEAHLQLAAARHDGYMARTNTMSHRLPGEPDLAPRIVAAGYPSSWCWVAENVGWTTDISQNGIAWLQNYMYNERPPENGHRLNILNPHLKQVGITIKWDERDRKIWFTQDFGSVRDQYGRCP